MKNFSNLKDLKKYLSYFSFSEWKSIIEKRDEFDYTLLYNACLDGDFERAEFLIFHGADVNVAIYDKTTPLIAASRHSNISLIELLIENGADVNVVNERNQSALSEACHALYEPSIKLLLNKGVRAYSGYYGEKEESISLRELVVGIVSNILSRHIRSSVHLYSSVFFEIKCFNEPIKFIYRKLLDEKIEADKAVDYLVDCFLYKERISIDVDEYARLIRLLLNRHYEKHTINC